MQVWRGLPRQALFSMVYLGLIIFQFIYGRFIPLSVVEAIG